MNQFLYILANMLINFFLLLLFLRFMVQWAKVGLDNPFAATIYRFSGFVDAMGKRLTIADGRINLSAALLMLVLYWLSFAINISFNKLPPSISQTPLDLFFIATIQAIVQFLSMLRYTIIAAILASWVVMLANVSNGLVYLLMQLSEPIIQPFRRLIPPLGMLDLSPLAALLALSLIQKFVEIVGGNIFLNY